MYLLQKHVLFVSSTLTGVGRSPFIFVEAAGFEAYVRYVARLAILLNGREI